MRATVTGLATAVLVLAAASAHAQPAFLRPPGVCVPPNPTFYGPGACQNCMYGPNYCFQGPGLPAQPFNGMVAFPRPQGQGQGQMAGYPGAPGGVPGLPPGVMGIPGYCPPGAMPVGFPSHPFARSPRDFFMYGQQWTE